MKLGCNWSVELDSLLVKSEVEIDYFKARTLGDYEKLFCDMRKTRPILLHGFEDELYAGTSNAHSIDFARLNRLLGFCGSPHFGIHLSMLAANVKSNRRGGDETQHTLPSPGFDKSGMTDYDICEKMITNLEIFKSKLDLPLLVENIPDCNRDRKVFGHHPFFDPDLISHVIKTADVGFLLDITHAEITCVYNGMDFCSYISKLPLDRVREIHVNGPGLDDAGDIADTHAAMTDADFNRLQWVLEHTKPEIITLEYGWQAESVYGADETLLRENLIRLKQYTDQQY